MKARARTFAELAFEHLGTIDVERGNDGVVRTFMPQGRYLEAATTPLNAYGGGPFCRFRIAQSTVRRAYTASRLMGPVYVGECNDLSVRWGLSQYGAISPKNCFQGGQSTNCRVNSAILVEALLGRRLDLWFASFDGTRVERLVAETALISSLNPAWNRAKRLVDDPR